MSNNILDQPVKKALLTMAAPAAIGMLMTFLFQLVDTYFIGKLGTNELAAIGFSYPVYLIIVSTFMGISAGVSSSVGRALGESNPQKARSLTLVSILTMAALTLILGFAGIVSVEFVFPLVGTPEDLLPLVREYMEPLYLGMFALVGGLVGNAAVMAKGLMIRATVVMGVGGIINLVLDYFLIFGVGPIEPLGLHGAGLATAISWLVILVLMTALLFKENLLSLREFGPLSRMRANILEVLTIGGPAVVAQILNPIAIAALTRAVAAYGTGAIAAFGIATRVESLALTGILSLSVILTPVVAQNFGARKMGRLDQVVAYSGRMTVYWGFAVYLVLVIAGPVISSIFTDDLEVIKATSYYFYIVGFSFPGFGLTLITTSFFNGIYEPRLSLKLTLIKSLVLTIPLALVGSLVSLDSIWIGIAIANIFGAIYAGKMLNNWLAKNDSSLVGHNPIKDYISDFRAAFGSKRSIKLPTKTRRGRWHARSVKKVLDDNPKELRIDAQPIKPD